MPGISIVKEKGIAGNKSNIINHLNSLNHLKYFQSNVFRCDKDLFIGWNTYKEYPINSFSYLHYDIIIEGRIYDKTESILRSELEQLINCINEDNFKIDLTKWIENTDGDFIISIIDKKNDNFFLFNDIFGRLPLYFKKTLNRICISRHLKFIIDIENEFDFDKLALSHYLLLGYMIGERTLFKEIKQLRPASLIVVNGDALNVSILHQFNFQIRKYASNDFKANLNELDRLFSDACKNRFNNGKQNIVTLSGGLDSRMVAACMHKNKIPFEAATISYSTGYAKEEVDVARQLSNLFKIKFNLFDISPPNGVDVYEQLLIKEGMNSLATAPIIPFYRKIAAEFGKDINFITGDNGDKLIFTIDKPFNKFKDLDHLANYIMEEHSVIPLETVSSILGTSKENILNDIKSVLTSFPEDDLVQKYIHFRIIEKPFKYAFQGEDRHRYYFWSLTPFWSTHFFNYIMNCSDASKIKHKLFGGVIKNFSPEAIMLPYTNFRSSIFSIKGKLMMFLIYNLYPNIPSRFRGGFKIVFFGGNPIIESDSVLLKCLLEQIKQFPQITQYLNLDNIQQQKNLRKTVLYNLMTVSSAIEYFFGKTSTLKKYSKAEF